MYLRLGLLSPPIRTSFDGLVAETIDDSASVTALVASIDTWMLLGKVDRGGGGLWECCLVLLVTSEGSNVWRNSNSSSVTYPLASYM